MATLCKRYSQNLILNRARKFCSATKLTNESRLIQSMEAIQKGTTEITMEKVEDIMEDIRNIDPHESSLTLNFKCSKFIEQFYRNTMDNNAANILQYEGCADMEFGYIMLQNVIECSQDSSQIIQALLQKADFAKQNVSISRIPTQKFYRFCG